MKGLGTTHAPLIASEVGMGLEVGSTCLHLFFFIKKTNNTSFIFIFFIEKMNNSSVEADNMLFSCLIFNSPMSRKPGKNSPLVFWNKQLLFNQFLS
jgi:hypothetical protein